MASVGDVTVTLRAIDEVTPALKRVHQQMWWHQHGEGLMRAVTVLLAASAFILGRITA